jgi:hypothetical protein
MPFRPLLTGFVATQLFFEHPKFNLTPSPRKTTHHPYSTPLPFIQLVHRLLYLIAILTARIALITSSSSPLRNFML